MPAQYFRNQDDIAPYLLNSAWLRELNNERWGDQQVGGSEDYLDAHPDDEGDTSPRNATLKANFVRLNKFVMFAFSFVHTLHISSQPD